MKKFLMIVIFLVIAIGNMDVNMFKFNYDSRYKIEEFKTKITKFIYLKKFGIISDSGEVIISPLFDDVKDIESSNRILVKRNNRWGIINKIGDIIISYEYENIRRLSSKNYIVQKADKWGIINEDNEILVPIEYKDIKVIGRKIFLMDTTSVEVFTRDLKKIKTYRGENIKILNEEGYLIRERNETFYIYKNQKIKIDEKVEQIYDNFLVIVENEKRYVKDILGKNKEIEKYEFDGIFIQNLKSIIVEKNRKYGVYNINMKEIIPVTFDKISGFYQKFYIYENEYKCGVINSSGNIILENEYNTIEEIKGKLIIASKDTGVGIVDTSQNVIVPFVYDDIKFIGSHNFVLFDKEKIIVGGKKNKYFELNKKEVLNIYTNQINTTNKIYIFR